MIKNSKIKIRNLLSLFIPLFFVVGILTLFGDKGYLSAENREAKSYTELSLKEIKDSSFVSSLNAVLQDQIKYRDKMQFLYQKSKNYLAGLFNVNSDTVIIDDELVSIGDGYYVRNMFSEPDHTEDAKNKGYNIKSLTYKYPDLKYYVYMPTRIEQTSLLDSETLSSTIQNCENSFKNEKGDAVTYKSLSVKSIEDYKEYYYMTDQHWNIKGAYKGYQDIIEMISNDFDLDSPREVIDEIVVDKEFYGHFANQLSNAVDKADCITDYDLGIDENSYNYYETVYGEDGELFEVEYSIKEHKQNYIDGTLPVSLSGYEAYFGDMPLIRRFDFHNEDKPNILIIADSFVNPVKDWIASHFNNTIIIDPRTAYSDFKIDPYLERYDIDAILLLEYYDSLFFNGFFYIPYE